MHLAYIDPTAGSMLLQVIFAGAAGVVVLFWKRLTGLFKRSPPTPPPDAQPPAVPPPADPPPEAK